MSSSNLPPKRRRAGSLIPALGEFKSIDSLLNLNLAMLQEEALLVDAKVYDKLQARLSSISSIIESASHHQQQQQQQSQSQQQRPHPSIAIAIATAMPSLLDISDTTTMIHTINNTATAPALPPLSKARPPPPSTGTTTLGMVHRDFDLELDQIMDDDDDDDNDDDDKAVQECTDLTHEISISEPTNHHHRSAASASASASGRQSSQPTPTAAAASNSSSSSQVVTSMSSQQNAAAAAAADDPTIDYNNNAMEPPVVGTVLPAEILRLLTLTGFLTTEELGKLLLLTSRSFAYILGDDFCWEMICRCKWSNTGRIPGSFIQHQDRGYQWFFHQMSQGEIVEDRPGLGPPLLTLDHLVVLLSIRDGNDSEVYSEILSPHVLESLVKDGTVTIDLEEAVLAAEFRLDGTTTNNNNNTTNNDDDDIDDEEQEDDNNDVMLFPDHLLPAEKCRNWMASVDFLRLDTHQSCCLHDSCDVEWEYEEDDEYDRHTFTGQDDRYGRLDFAPQFHRLELTDEGRLLERRIQLGDFFKDGLEGTGYQGFRVHVSLLCFQSQSETPDDDNDHDDDDDDNIIDDDPSTSIVQFEFRQAKLEVYQLVGDYQPGELLNGNVLLHLWNELLGWDG